MSMHVRDYTRRGAPQNIELNKHSFHFLYFFTFVNLFSSLISLAFSSPLNYFNEANIFIYMYFSNILYLIMFNKLMGVHSFLLKGQVFIKSWICIIHLFDIFYT